MTPTEPAHNCRRFLCFVAGCVVGLGAAVGGYLAWGPTQGRAEVALTRVTIREAGRAVDLFVQQNGRLPTGFQELVAARFLAKLPLDAWGQPLELVRGTGFPKGYSIRSRGDPDHPGDIWLHATGER